MWQEQQDILDDMKARSVKQWGGEVGMSPKERAKYLHLRELFSEAETTTVSQDVQRQLAAEKRKTILDESLVRQQEDWSLLSGQVVGGEDRRQRRLVDGPAARSTSASRWGQGKGSTKTIVDW